VTQSVVAQNEKNSKKTCKSKKNTIFASYKLQKKEITTTNYPSLLIKTNSK